MIRITPTPAEAERDRLRNKENLRKIEEAKAILDTVKFASNRGVLAGMAYDANVILMNMTKMLEKYR